MEIVRLGGVKRTVPLTQGLQALTLQDCCHLFNFVNITYRLFDHIFKLKGCIC